MKWSFLTVLLVVSCIAIKPIPLDIPGSGPTLPAGRLQNRTVFCPYCGQALKVIKEDGSSEQNPEKLRPSENVEVSPSSDKLAWYVDDRIIYSLGSALTTLGMVWANEKRRKHKR